jgi:hypothetical protein
MAKDILETRRGCTWRRLFQKHVVTIPGEGYSRNCQGQLRCVSGITFVKDNHDVFLEQLFSGTVTMCCWKVIPETRRGRP